MKKKIDLFWYWFIFVVAFVLCFFVVNDKKIDAYELDNNGNIVSSNLFNINNLISPFPDNPYVTVDYELGTITIDNQYANVSGKKLKELAPSLEVGKEYIISANTTANNRFIYLFGTNNIWSYGTSRVISESDLNSQVGFYGNNDSVGGIVTIKEIRINEGNISLPYEPFGTWYNESFVGDLAIGVISFNSASLTYDNIDYGTSHSIFDVSSYIDSSFGFLYFERLWDYLDTFTSSGYDNAWLTLQLNNKMNLNTTYILNAMFNNGNYGVGVKFYQGNTLILDVTNWSNNQYAYCNESSGATCSVELSKFVNVGDFPQEQNSFTYFDKIEVWSGDTDKRIGSFGFQNISYNQGYNSGYNIGYSTGNSNGEKIGYDKGYNRGYLYGYEKGVDTVEGTDNTLVGLVGGIMTAPVNMLKTIFDFEFLGINLTDFIFSMVSLFIVIWLIKIFL